MNKEFNFTLNVSTGGAIVSTGDCSIKRRGNVSNSENNKSSHKVDKRAHLFSYIGKTIMNGINYIQYKSKDGIGYCPVANIGCIINQFDSDITAVIN